MFHSSKRCTITINRDSKQELQKRLVQWVLTVEEWDKYIESCEKFKALVYIKQAIVPFVVARKVYNLSLLLSVMPSFREIRGLLLLSHGSNFISEEEFLVFLRGISVCQLVFSHSSLTLMTWKMMNVWWSFALQWSKIDRMEGLCMLLRRFVYPWRYSDMVPCFGRPVPILSMATNKVLNHIYHIRGHFLTDWNPYL